MPQDPCKCVWRHAAHTNRQDLLSSLSPLDTTDQEQKVNAVHIALICINCRGKETENIAASHNIKTESKIPSWNIHIY